MKSYRISTLVKLALLAASNKHIALHLVSSYTFDPLNNSWKPSGRRKKQNRGSSFSQNSYAPPEPRREQPNPVPRPIPGVDITWDERDIVRHHYTTFVVGDQEEQQINDPAFVPKASLVEIQYNKKTGEVSLLDEEGVVTPEEYKRIVNDVKYSHEGESESSTGNTSSKPNFKHQGGEDDAVVGTTVYLDPEDLDPTDVIDTEVEDVDGRPSTSAKQEIHIPHYEQKLKDYPQPQLQDQSQPSTDYTESILAETTFDSYSIHPPAAKYDHSVAYQAAATGSYAEAQQQQQLFQQQQYQKYQNVQQPVQTTTAVAEPTADHVYYQQQQQYETGNYDYQEYYEPTMMTQKLTNDQSVEDIYFDDGTYRKSRGFGFASRRESFTDSELEY